MSSPPEGDPPLQTAHIVSPPLLQWFQDNAPGAPVPVEVLNALCEVIRTADYHTAFVYATDGRSLVMDALRTLDKALDAAYPDAPVQAHETVAVDTPEELAALAATGDFIKPKVP